MVCFRCLGQSATLNRFVFYLFTYLFFHVLSILNICTQIWGNNNNLTLQVVKALLEETVIYK